LPEESGKAFINGVAKDYVSDNLNNLISSIKEICTKEGIELLKITAKH
jgi:hypothetical protein